MSIIDYLEAGAFIKFEKLRDRFYKKAKENLDSEQVNIINELKEKGVVVIPEYYSHSQCDAIQAAIDEMIKDPNVNVKYDELKSDARVFASHRYSNEIMKFHEDSYLKSIGEAYTGCELINSHTLGARLEAKKNNLGSGGGWHRDSVYKIQYKSIAYLTDVEEENGPFEFILGSHNKSSVTKSIKENNFEAHHNRFTESEVEDFLQSNPDFKNKIYTAKKGSVILVDTSGVHRGMPINQGKRYALTNYYFPKHHYNKNAQAKFEKLF